MTWPGGEDPRGPYHPPSWRPLPSMPPMLPMPPRPLPPMPGPPEPNGVGWALVPFLTFGFGTPFSFLYAAVRRRSLNLGVTSAAYAGGSALVTVLISANSPVAALGALLMMLLWVAGTTHAFAVRPSVYPRRTPRDRANEHAIHVAQYRRLLREDARALAAGDPSLAHELRIGRPDLPRAYDDGGLIDVNHAPPPTLALLPGLTPELVERIVRVRTEHGGFVSAEELAVDADLPPGMLPRLAEYSVFLP